MRRRDYYIIDAHCHIYPEKIAAKAVKGTDVFYDTEAFGTGIAENLISEGEKAGVSAFVVQSVATTPKQVASINEFIAQTVKDSGGKLTGLGTLHPESPDMKRDVSQILELGLHGVKLHPDIQKFRIDDPEHWEMYALCEEMGLPILMHTGDVRYHYSNPENLIPVLKAFPKLTVVGAHLGGWSLWEEASLKLADFENLYVDSSSSFATIEKQIALGKIPYLSEKKAVEVIRRYGVDKVLFGTDYPMWSPHAELDFFFSLGFSEEDSRKMLSENAKKVFSVD